MLRFLVAALVVAVPPARAQIPSPLRVLFVGNSYTYENNLPFVFEALADPVRDVDVAMMASGGATLRRHVERSGVLDSLSRFDVVVLQEQSLFGPTRLVEGLAVVGDPADYRGAVREIAAAARRAGTRVVLFATWPREDTPRFLAALHNPVVDAAAETGATVAPVGLVWERLGDRAGLDLYGPDGSHPSLGGTYVAAVVLARAVLGQAAPLRPVVGVPLMDGRGLPSGATADIRLDAPALSAVGAAVEASGGEGHLPEPPVGGGPVLPSVVFRGRLGPAFLTGAWTGTFATFGRAEQATLTVAFEADSARVSMAHTGDGFPADEEAVVGVQVDGDVLSVGYRSADKECDVRVDLVRFGTELRGTVRFASDRGYDWVRSSVVLHRR